MLREQPPNEAGPAQQEAERIQARPAPAAVLGALRLLRAVADRGLDQLLHLPGVNAAAQPLAAQQLRHADAQLLRKGDEQRRIRYARAGFPHLKTLVYIQSILPTKR